MTHNPELDAAVEKLRTLARRFGDQAVVEVCDPHPDNPSPNIEPVFGSVFKILLASIPSRAPSKDVATTEPRFFIDHGMIHDRVTGRHVTTAPDDETWNGQCITDTCALLNSLISSRAPVEGEVTFSPEQKQRAMDLIIPDHGPAMEIEELEALRRKKRSSPATPDAGLVALSEAALIYTRISGTAALGSEALTAATSDLHKAAKAFAGFTIQRTAGGDHG